MKYSKKVLRKLVNLQMQVEDRGELHYVYFGVYGKFIHHNSAGWSFAHEPTFPPQPTIEELMVEFVYFNKKLGAW